MSLRATKIKHKILTTTEQGYVEDQNNHIQEEDHNQLLQCTTHLTLYDLEAENGAVLFGPKHIIGPTNFHQVGFDFVNTTLNKIY